MKHTKTFLIMTTILLVLAASVYAEWRYFGRTRNPQFYTLTPAGTTKADGYTAVGNGISNSTTINPIVFDIDDDGINELLIPNRANIYVYDENLNIQAETPVFLPQSNFLVWNYVTTNDYTYEIGLVANNSFHHYEVKNDTINRTGGFSLNNNTGDWYRITGVYAKTAAKNLIAVLNNHRFDVYDTAGVLQFTYNLEVADGNASNIYLSKGGHSGDSYGDWDLDGDTDFCFWHRYNLTCIDESGNLDLLFDSETEIYDCSSGMIYPPILFLDFDGGNHEIAFATYCQGGVESYVVGVDNDGTQLFNRDTTTRVYGGRGGWLSTYDVYGGTGEWTGDELLYFFHDSGENLFVEMYNENGYQDIDYTPFNSTGAQDRVVYGARGDADGDGNFNDFWIAAGAFPVHSVATLFNISAPCSAAQPCIEIHSYDKNYCQGWAGAADNTLIFDDINNDGKAEVLSWADSGGQVCTTDYTNAMPDLTGFDWDTSSPICINNIMTYSVLSSDYTDAESDAVAINIDCYGNTTLSGWSSFSSYPTQTCNYSSIGEFTPVVWLTDNKHIGTLTESLEMAQALVVASAGCYESGDGGGSQTGGSGSGGSFTDYGIPTNITDSAAGSSDYAAQYFDWEGQGCNDWDVMRGFCPMYKWGMQALTDLWAWIAFYFLSALVLVALATFVLVYVRRHK